jgi:putative transposase
MEKRWKYGIERITKGVMDMVNKEIQPRKCKYCGSYHVVRFGRSKDTQMQRLICKGCGKTFMDTDSLPGMKTPREQVASALNMYYEGMSLNAIRRHLQQMHNNYPSDSTVYEWIDRFTDVAVKQAKELQPAVGDVWVADETVSKIGGKKVWFWDLIDAKTRFLLASHLSEKRTTHDARVLMARAARRAGKPPKMVITDQLAAYIDGIELNFGSETKHIAAKNLRASPGTQLIERFHSTLKARTKVMRGLKSLESARELMNGWLVHYNFFRPHEALNDRTPAEMAGITYKVRNWLDVINLQPHSVTVRSQRDELVGHKEPKITPHRPRKARKRSRVSNEIELGAGIVQDKRTGRRHLRLT